jgi:hypothetical protein
MSWGIGISMTISSVFICEMKNKDVVDVTPD